MESFNVWLEGYAATGESGKANFEGKWEGETFKEAVEKMLVQKEWDLKLYDSGQISYWGCKFYDNEKDAREILALC